MTEPDPTPGSPLEEASLRLRFATEFTVHGEDRCYDCGEPFARGDEVTETRLHTELVGQGKPYFHHKSCWEKRSVGVYYPDRIFTWDDTREFTTEADHHLAIVVQVAVCHDPASGATRLGRATYYLRAGFASDPLFSLQGAQVVYTALDVPVPSEVHAARVLAEISPAEFDWDGTNHPTENGPGGDWIAAHWPETIFDRYARSQSEQD
jgi:hypothetical protein